MFVSSLSKKVFRHRPRNLGHIFVDGFRALFTHFLGISYFSFVFAFFCFLFSFSFILAFCFVWFFASSSNLSTSMSASPVGFGFRPGLVFVFGFGLLFLCCCAVGCGAAVSGKCYLTASVTLHNCSHFLDCATVAVAVAVAALLKFIVVLSLLPHIRCHGWCPGHYDYLERITRPRLEPKQK